ncbi:MAG: class I SAM-dependent methyltransferase [Deltaproteobacteria bacterium]|nr:class I SAM-dependent methyltransferase [Deltaproteobacteria bacterium]MDQ3296651.1 class I SAM-dependent methyltransferase [Myxococcota bacterium]
MVNAPNGKARPEQLWNQRDVVATYTSRRYVTPAEVRVIAECWSNIKDARVLDVGIGTGRTIPYLAPFARRYVGVDFVPNMVAAAQRLHPGRDLRQADARELPFGDGEFDFVLFSFNGIDYAGPDARPRMHAEIRRVLAPGGLFAYSTHNLDSRDTPKTTRFVPEIPKLSASPIRSAVRVARGVASAVRGYRNYRRFEPLQQVGDGISFIMDGAHDYGHMSCYVTQEYERRALATAGYDVRAVLDPDGNLAAARSRARDLYFIAARR